MHSSCNRRRKFRAFADSGIFALWQGGSASRSSLALVQRVHPELLLQSLSGLRLDTGHSEDLSRSPVQAPYPGESNDGSDVQVGLNLQMNNPVARPISDFTAEGC